jgi:hypothetical protein
LGFRLESCGLAETADSAVRRKKRRPKAAFFGSLGRGCHGHFLSCIAFARFPAISHEPLSSIIISMTLVKTSATSRGVARRISQPCEIIHRVLKIDFDGGVQASW